MSASLLSISVDLEPASHTATAPSGEALAWTVRRLVDRLTSQRRAVTWVTSDPAGSQETRWALEANCGHEAALLVRAAWSGYQNGRSRFATEFLRRKRRAQQNGISLTTLAAADGIPREHLELLVRQGVTAIRADRSLDTKPARHRAAANGIAPLRYGLWRLTSDLRFVGGSWLSERVGAGRINRTIDRWIAAGIAGHLTIDAPAMAAHSSAKFRGLETVLRHIERRERDGTLEVGTIAETIARLAAPRVSRSAKSILRAA